MANTEHLAILNQGVDAWNEWRLKYPHAKIDLRQADLRERELAGINMGSADLSESKLRLV